MTVQIMTMTLPSKVCEPVTRLTLLIQEWRFRFLLLGIGHEFNRCYLAGIKTAGHVKEQQVHGVIGLDSPIKDLSCFVLFRNDVVGIHFSSPFVCLLTSLTSYNIENSNALVNEYV